MHVINFGVRITMSLESLSSANEETVEKMSVAHKEENNVENLRRSQRRGRILPKP